MTDNSSNRNRLEIIISTYYQLISVFRQAVVQPQCLEPRGIGRKETSRYCGPARCSCVFTGPNDQSMCPCVRMFLCTTVCACVHMCVLSWSVEFTVCFCFTNTIPGIFPIPPPPPLPLPTVPHMQTCTHSMIHLSFYLQFLLRKIKYFIFIFSLH